MREREEEKDVAVVRRAEMRSPRSVGAGLLLRGGRGNGVCAERGPSREACCGILRIFRGRELDRWRVTETLTSSSMLELDAPRRVLGGVFSSPEGKGKREDCEAMLY